jgi:O-antigen/teichoic acid export membrane protein
MQTRADTTQATTPVPGASQNEDIRLRVLSGFRWSMINVGTAQILQIAVGLVLVRLLSPHEYGLAGMALLFSSLVLLMSDLSMGAALVQRHEISEMDRSSVFWASAGIGTFLTIGGVALSGPLANFYRQPEVQPLFAVVSVTFLLLALQTTQASLMQREMRFRLLNVRRVAAAIVGSAVAVAAALLGAGAWALILQQVAVSVVGTVVLWRGSPWRPHFMFSWRSLQDFGGFGLNLFGSNLLTYVRNNTDNLLVGRFLGSAALGAYAVSYNLVFLPVVRMIVPIQDALFPALARWQADLDRIAEVWLRVLRLVAAALMPAMLGLVVIAPEFVAVVFGDKWRSAVPVIRILSVVALAQCIALLGQRVLAAIDRVRLIFRFSIVESTLTIAAFAVGLRWGIVGVAVCYLCVSVPLQVAFLALTARAVGASALEVGRSLAGVFVASAVMTGACLGLRSALVTTHIGAALQLSLVITAGIATYALACSILAPQVIRELRSVRSRRRGGEALAVAA